MSRIISGPESVLYDIMKMQHARCMADEWFVNVGVVSEDQGDLIAQVQKALASTEGRNGQCGTCVIVGIPDSGVEKKNIPSPPLECEPWFMVLENPMINRTVYNPLGTNKPAMMTARRLIRLFHNFQMNGVTNNIVAQDRAIRAIPTTLAPVGIGVYFKTTEIAPANTKVPSPKLVYDPGAETVTITCTDPDATIMFTLDGSYPGQKSQAYGQPITVASGQSVLAVCNKSGSVASDCIKITIP